MCDCDCWLCFLPPVLLCSNYRTLTTKMTVKVLFIQRPLKTFLLIYVTSVQKPDLVFVSFVCQTPNDQRPTTMLTSFFIVFIHSYMIYDIGKLPTHKLVHIIIIIIIVIIIIIIVNLNLSPLYSLGKDHIELRYDISKWLRTYVTTAVDWAVVTGW
jgi:hypothetical protein